MNIKKLFYTAILYFLLLILPLSVYTQICVDDYFAISFNTPTVHNQVAVIPASDNEILSVSNVFRYNSFLQAGLLTRFSSQGTILWSRQYYTSLYNFVNFTNIIQAENGSYIVTGNIGDVDTTVWPVAHLSEYGLMLKVDKYGNIIWSKILSSIVVPFAFSNINTIDKMGDGSLILSLNYSTSKQYIAVMRMNTDGAVMWTSLMSSASNNAGFGSSKVKILSNDNIVFGCNANVLDNNYSYQRRGYSLNCLDGKTGEKLWNRFFLSRDTLSLSQAVLGDIVNITELPNHNISFITSYAEAPMQIYFRKTNQILNFIIDNNGIFKSVLSYTTSEPSVYASSVTESGNGRLILMDNGDAPFLMSINTQGDILWQKGYALTGRGQVTKSVLSTKYGYYFFCSTNDGGSRDFKLIKTDNSGNVPCEESAFSTTVQDVTPSFSMQPLDLNFENASGLFSDIPLPGAYDYSMQHNNICRIACCQDVTDTADEVRLCNMPFYILLNKDTVKNSGIYTATYKSSKGCDSIVYQNVIFNFTPTAMLGADTCFGDKSSLVLKAPTGYEKYFWNGTSTANNNYVANQPGIYTLSISNECGMAADTVQIFEECEFDVYIPNAFTPNGDGLNDRFRIPPQNYNRLISFTIFNRWGEKIFATKNIEEGWNGMNKEYPAPTGTYIYIIVMKSLDDKKTVTKKGVVTLIR